MARAGGGLRAWGSLLLLGLCSWTGARAAAPSPVTNLTVAAQTNSSVTLHWGAPEGSDPRNLTYWVRWSPDGDTNVTQNTTDTSFTVDGLGPGSSYTFFVWVEEGGVTSPEESVNATTAPNQVRNLKVDARTNSSVTLRWDAPEGPDPHTLTYWVQWPGEGSKNETQNTTDTSVTVPRLKPASSYEFSVWAEKEGVPGSMETLEAATAPNQVRNLKVDTQTNSSVTLRWDAPEGPDPHALTYWVQWPGEGSKNETQNTTDTSVTVPGLKPASSYEFSVWAEKEGVPGSMETLEAATAPNPVRNLRVDAQTNMSIALRWDIPAGSDPQTLTYFVQCLEDGDKNQTHITKDTSVMVAGLQPGTLYDFWVWVETNRVNSSKETRNAATAPNEVTHLRNENQSSTSVTLRWGAPADPSSQLYTYRVQWALEGHPQRTQDPPGRANMTGQTNETWYEVEALEPGALYNFSVWAERNDVASSAQSLLAPTAPVSVTITSCVSTSGGYGVILTWSCPSGGYEAFELQVGEQRDSRDRSACGSGVSVSGLGPARSYAATVTTVWSGLKAQSPSVTCHTESAGVIIGAIVGVVLFLVLVGLLIFFLKRRNKQQKQKEVPRGLVFSFPGHILAEDFPDHVRQNKKDSNYGFAEEYQRLILEDQSCSQLVASAPENKAKNRYRNVLPYDWSRVPLRSFHEEPGSDYINASFLPGFRSPREFIAAQGPLPQTVGDFWRMVWEQQSRTLVMLTNCMESGRVKCEHYWPLDSQPCTHGHLQVALVGEEVTENWAVRDLQLLHMEEQKTLFVRQFHYLAWPDHDVPHSPAPVLAFWKMIRQWLDQTMEGGPPIVHCSAGVGRTGTFVALDALLGQLQSEGRVGPFDFVRKMRESRPLMVQTEGQYVFLHQCILSFLQQSAPAPACEATYENVAGLGYENTAAIRAHEMEA